MARKSNSSNSTSSKSASIPTPISKWHRDAKMEFQMLSSWYSKRSSDENVEEVADPSSKVLSWAFSEWSLTVPHWTLWTPILPHPSQIGRQTVTRCRVHVLEIFLDWYNAALLGRVGRNFLRLQIHGIFVVVHACMLHRCDLGFWATRAQSAHNPSVAALHIYSLSMLFSAASSCHYFFSPLRSSFDEEKKKAPNGT